MRRRTKPRSAVKDRTPAPNDTRGCAPRCSPCRRRGCKAWGPRRAACARRAPPVPGSPSATPAAAHRRIRRASGIDPPRAIARPGRPASPPGSAAPPASPRARSTGRSSAIRSPAIPRRWRPGLIMPRLAMAWNWILDDSAAGRVKPTRSMCISQIMSGSSAHQPKSYWPATSLRCVSRALCRSVMPKLGRPRAEAHSKVSSRMPTPCRRARKLA